MIPPQLTPEQQLEDFTNWLAHIIKPGVGLERPTSSHWDMVDGKQVMSILDLGMNSVPTPIWHCINIVDSEVTDYLLLALDMSRHPTQDQGIEFEDFILVCEFDRRRPEPNLTSQWRYGVINYDKSKDPVTVRPIDWNNAHWQKHGAWYMKEFGPPFRVRVTRRRDFSASTPPPPKNMQ